MPHQYNDVESKQDNTMVTSPISINSPANTSSTSPTYSGSPRGHMIATTNSSHNANGANDGFMGTQSDEYRYEEYDEEDSEDDALGYRARHSNHVDGIIASDVEEQKQSLLHNDRLRTDAFKTIREKYLLKLGYCPLILEEDARKTSQDLLNMLPHENPRLPQKKATILYGKGTAVSSGNQHPDIGTSSGIRPSHNKPKKGTLRWHFRPGSTMSSVFNLCSATLGAGALSLPNAFAKSGVVLGSIFLLIGAWLTVYSIHLLIDCRIRTRLNSYEDLSMKFFSKRFALFVEVNIALFCLGILVAYIVAAADIVHPVMVKFLSGPGSVFTNRTVLILVLVGGVMLPLSFNEMVSSLRYASLIGVASIVYLVLAICGASLVHLSKNGLPHLDFYQMFNLSWDVCLSIPIIMFAFTNQVNVFSIFTELHRPCIRRMRNVVKNSTAITFSLYLAIGLCGYLQNLDKTKSDILDNYSITQPAIAVAQVCVGITVILAFPINVFPLRFTIDVMLFPNSTPSRLGVMLRTTVLVGISTVMAIFVPNIDTVFALTGSFCSSLVCFILPGVFHLKINPGPLLSREKLPALCLTRRLCCRHILHSCHDLEYRRSFMKETSIYLFNLNTCIRRNYKL